ncbi:MAG TPA: galactokinase [Chthoniobacterales bacterium]|nr:galactokinase [Chthoniobacterales bacterium]
MCNEAISFAPGRVELLGNHTDYNQGLVLSAAIHLGVTVRARKDSSNLITVSSATNGRRAEIDIPSIARLHTESWANYPLGVIETLRQTGFPLGGTTIDIDSNLPLGAGLSSSAALEVATAFALRELYQLPLDPMQIAKLCQQAENEFVGVQCGLLDQASSVFGQAGKAILLDFRSVTAEPIGLPSEVAILLLASGIPHALTGGEYNERREQCARAAALLGVTALRETTTAAVQAAKMDPVVQRRALHITGENERVSRGIKALRRDDPETFGQLMFESHRSSRDNFENSTPALDCLVEIAEQTSGVYGSRLTGGGFGGSTVSLVSRAQADQIKESMVEQYFERMGIRSSSILTLPSQGAVILASSSDETTNSNSG